MDVTSLLNNAQQPCYGRGGIADSSKNLNHGKLLSSPNALGIPWEEDSNQSSGRDNRQNANFWDARVVGAANESDSQSRTGPPISPKHVHGVAFEAGSRPTRPSAGFIFGITSQLPIQLARNSLCCDDAQTCSTQITPQGSRVGFLGDASTIPKHKLSFSNSSFVSSGSPLSEGHSRLSSVASVSGISSSSIPIVETPLIYAKRFKAQSPQFDLDITTQPLLPSPTEEGSAAKPNQPSITKHVSTNRSDAVLNLNKLERPVVFGGGLNSESTSRLKYHKRATSAPILASRTTTSAPYPLNDRYLASSSAQLVMGKSSAKGLPSQAEELETNITVTYQDFDPERRLHPALRNVHANAVVDRLPARGAVLQSQEQVLNQASDITPLAQLACDIAREASLEALNSASMAPLEAEPRCMFVDDCQTGSQLRKAISHLFGRNKACTLRIPKQVWVYYCRKHYQRIRYRNAKTYPLNQMYLVKMQINRLQRWSDENQRQGAGPYIKLWTLALRKREQSRLDKEADAAEEGDDESQETPNSSAAPDWIIQRLGTGYTTEQMLEVADRLYLEIENGTLGQVPEVEFLPDITEPEAGNISKLVRNRKQSRTAAVAAEPKVSKRRISEDAGSIGQKDSSPPIQPDVVGFENLSRKRIRLSPPGADYHQHPLQTPLPSITMTPYANNRVLASSSGIQSAVPRTLPAVPKMQIPSPDHSQRPIAHMYGLSSSEFRRPSGLGDFYSHNHQQNAAHYRVSAESLVQRNRDYHNQQRLPSIAHLAGVSDIQDSKMAIPPYRGSWASIHDDPNMPRAPRLRSYSDNIPTSQPVLEYPRPSSSGTSQFGLTYFDSRVSTSSSHEPNTRSYSREQWPESSQGYAPGWPQRSGIQQQHNYYDQVTRPQLDSLRAPAYLGTNKQRVTAERAEQEAHHYGGSWVHADPAVAKAAGGTRED